MDKKLSRIHKFNIGYYFLKVAEKIAFSAFYRKVEVVGRKNIPYGNPIIFTPNHQNALMDALAVLNTCGLNLVFMARADIFKNKRQANMLSFLKILPIYRQRDGTDELSRNNEIFDLALTILEDKKSVCLMPEGNHYHQRRLRPLVKGSFRIAFSAQEKFGDKLNVKILPVGIDYAHYQNIHQDLLINYGQPIEINDYMDLYRENPPRAINALKDRLSEELKKVMIHIQNEEYYDTYHELRSLYNKRMRNRLGILKKSHYFRFQADKEMIRILDDNFSRSPDEMKTLSARVIEYAQGVKKLKLRNWIFDKKGYSFSGRLVRLLCLIIGFPLFLAGWLINFIPYTLPQYMIRNVKDAQFHASFKFGIAFLFFPVYYIILAVIVALITGPAWIPLVFIAFGVATGYFALYYSFWFKKLRAAIKYKRLIKRSDPEIINLTKLHETIISAMNERVENYLKRYIPETKIINMSIKDFYKDKIIWITGASSGIGEALVKILASWDAKLIISSNREDELERVKRECGTKDEKIIILPVDLSIPEQVEKAADAALQLSGGVDFLFNNGGISQRSVATETLIETDRKIMEINYFSGIIITKKLLPSMIARGSGHIIATSSLTGKFGLPYRSAYAASKHALLGYYESVWMELHDKGIRTSLVFPGAVRTNLSIDAIGPGGKAHGKMDDLQAHGIPPEKCALDILKGVRKNRREIFTGSKELRGVFVRRLFPRLFFRLIIKKNRV